MSIDKSQWVEIEEILASWMPCIEFKLGDHKVSIQRISAGEGKTQLAVYLDDHIKGEWFSEEKRPDIINQIWRPRSKAIYAPKEVKSIQKDFGKRDAKKYFPNLHDRQNWCDPMFPKASVLVRQFKKIDGLILVKK